MLLPRLRHGLCLLACQCATPCFRPDAAGSVALEFQIPPLGDLLRICPHFVSPCPSLQHASSHLLPVSTQVADVREDAPLSTPPQPPPLPYPHATRYFKVELCPVLSPGEQLPRDINLESTPVFFGEFGGARKLTEEDFHLLLHTLQDAPQQHVIGLLIGGDLFMLFCILF